MGFLRLRPLMSHLIQEQALLLYMIPLNERIWLVPNENVLSFLYNSPCDSFKRSSIFRSTNSTYIHNSQSSLPQGMQARPMWKKEVKLDLRVREKALAAHWLYRQIKVVVMNIHRRRLRGLGKWLLVNQHLFSLIGKLKQASINLVLYCIAWRKATQSAVAWLLLAWNLHTAFCPFSASNWTWCSGDPTNPTFSKQS